MIRHTAWDDKDDTVESRLKQTKFLIEATGNEWHTLWARWCEASNECRTPLIKDWKQLGGWILTIGELDNRPVSISLNWDSLDGFLVCNWEASSQVVDYVMIEKWFKKHYDQYNIGYNQCNAMNFHQCMDELRKWREKC